MNNYFIRLQGKANIPEPLYIGHNFKIEADCSITQEHKIDNENGEYDIVYKAEPVNVTITKDNGEIVKAKDPRRNSEKFRKYLWKLWSDEGMLTPFDEVYEKVTLKAMSEMPRYLREINQE